MLHRSLSAHPGNAGPGRRLISVNQQSAFTLIELLVVVAIIALLISILLPSLANAREKGKRAACGAQQHQIVLALQTYAAEEKGWFPYGLQFPAFPFGYPPTGATQYYGPWTDAKTAQGYPAYLALYKLKHAPAGKVFYCPAQQKLRYGGADSWPGEPGNLQNSGNWSKFLIGYSYFAGYWMGKDATDTKNPKSTRGDSWLSHYPGNREIGDSHLFQPFRLVFRG
jgi:prepilin-type N-terminal cleavage/methylation domain-containing protein